MTKNILKRLSSLWLAIIMVIMIIPATAVTVSAVNVGDMVPIMGMSVDGLYAERTYYETINQSATIGSDYINLHMDFSQDSCGDTGAYNTDLYIKLYNIYNETAVISFETSGLIRVNGNKYQGDYSFFFTLAPDACVTLSLTSDLFQTSYMEDVNTSIKNIKVTKGAQKTITETVTPYVSKSYVSAGETFTVGYHGLVSAPASVFIPQFRVNGTEEWTDQWPALVGTYDIRGYCPSSLQYTECYTQTVTNALTISKSSSAPTIIFPTASTSPVGGETDTLANVVLMGGSTELGTFAWQAPDTAVSVGSLSYTMMFTPSEEAKATYNFTSDTVTRQVTVKGVKRHQTPEAETDYINGGLKNLVPGADYVLSHKELANDNIIYQYLTADANGKAAFSDTVNSFSEFSLVRVGDGVNSFDSSPQKFKFVVASSSPINNITVTHATSYDSNDGKIAIPEPDPNCRYFYSPEGAGFSGRIEFTSTYEVNGLAAGTYTIYVFYPDAIPYSFLQPVYVAPAGSPIAVTIGNNIKLNKDNTSKANSFGIKNITDAELTFNSFAFASDDIFSFTPSETSNLAANYSAVVGMIHVKAGLDEGVYEDELIITYNTNKTYILKIRLTVGPCSGHTYSTFKSNKNGTHSSNCDKCGDTATWDCVGGFANCQSAAVCKECDTAYGTTDKTKHSTFTWRYTDTTHEYYCTRCGDVEISGTHGNYNNYTPDGNGSHTKACECGKTFTESCYGHSGDCTTVLKCACTYTLAENTAHTGGEATCTKVAECELCHTEYGELDPTNHNTTKNGGTPADCCTSGIKDSWHCADCGKDFAEEGCVTDITGDLTLPTTGEHADKDPWMTDSAKHWRICDVGGTKYAEGEHIPGPAATEQAPQICTTCEYVLTDKLEHKHSFGEVAEEEFKVSDATCLESAVYYRSCACGEKSTETFKVGEPDAAKHTGTNDKLVSDNAGKHNVIWTCCGEIFDENVVCTPTTLDDSCLTAEICSCGYVTKAAESAHDFSGAYLYDAEGHLHVCKRCEQSDTKSAHTGGTATCQEKANCSVCGSAYGELAEHSFTVAQNDETMHWSKCEDCDEIDIKQAHSFNNGTKCSVCEYEKEEITTDRTEKTTEEKMEETTTDRTEDSQDGAEVTEEDKDASSGGSASNESGCGSSSAISASVLAILCLGAALVISKKRK